LKNPSMSALLKFRACLLVFLLSIWKTIANGARSAASELLFTTYSCWQWRYEQIWNLLSARSISLDSAFKNCNGVRQKLRLNSVRVRKAGRFLDPKYILFSVLATVRSPKYLMHSWNAS
jgi:hypothetical protein